MKVRISMHGEVDGKFLYQYAVRARGGGDGLQAAKWLLVGSGTSPSILNKARLF